MWLDILALFGWWLLSAVKFLFVPFLYIQSNDGTFTHLLTSIVVTSTGGAAGAVVFFHLSAFIISRRKRGKPIKFTTTKRKIIGIKQRWGLRGILFISAIISVPLAAIITAKFYRHTPKSLTKLIIALTIWSIALSLLSFAIKHITTF
jgi:hypothetical protein